MLRLQLSVNNEENLSELHIRNVGGDEELADYQVSLYDGPWKMDKQALLHVTVQSHRRKDGPRWLVYTALIALSAKFGMVNLRG